MPVIGTTVLPPGTGNETGGGDVYNGVYGQTSTVSAGALPITWTLTVDGVPLADADAWLTRDIAGTQVVDRQRSDTNGQVRFLADKFVPGTTTLITYYGWAQKDGVVSVQAEPLTCD